MSNQEVAKTILAQLGGRMFQMMTGAKAFTSKPDALAFRLPGTGGFTRNGINYVDITLDPMDTYTVKFYRVRGVKVTLVSEHDDIFVDMLRPLFTRETGLDTSLGTTGARA
jgi:hypothetical protein